MWDLHQKHPERLQPPLLGESGMLVLELQRRVWDFIFLKGLHLSSSIVYTHVYVCVRVCVYFFYQNSAHKKTSLILKPHSLNLNNTIAFTLDLEAGSV